MSTETGWGSQSRCYKNSSTLWTCSSHVLRPNIILEPDHQRHLVIVLIKEYILFTFQLYFKIKPTRTLYTIKLPLIYRKCNTVFGLFKLKYCYRVTGDLYVDQRL